MNFTLRQQKWAKSARYGIRNFSGGDTGDTIYVLLKSAQEILYKRNEFLLTGEDSPSGTAMLFAGASFLIRVIHSTANVPNFHYPQLKQLSELRIMFIPSAME